MKIEILFPEICNLFGDMGNMKYLKKCLPNAEFISTAFGDKPLFASEQPNLIYLAPSNEKNQELIIKALLPYRDRLKELIDNGTPMLFTGNSGEILFKEIENYDGRKIPALNIFPFTAKREQYTRFNGLNHGTMEQKFSVSEASLHIGLVIIPIVSLSNALRESALIKSPIKRALW